MLANGSSGSEAVAAWVKSRGPALDRVRGAVQDMTRSGMTLSKLAVAASLLGDLAKE